MAFAVFLKWPANNYMWARFQPFIYSNVTTIPVLSYTLIIAFPFLTGHKPESHCYEIGVDLNLCLRQLLVGSGVRSCWQLLASPLLWLPSDNLSLWQATMEPRHRWKRNKPIYRPGDLQQLSNLTLYTDGHVECSSAEPEYWSHQR